MTNLVQLLNYYSITILQIVNMPCHTVPASEQVSINEEPDKEFYKDLILSRMQRERT